MQDELNYIKILEKAGIERKQAEAHVNVLGKAMDDDLAKQSKMNIRFTALQSKMDRGFNAMQAEMDRRFDAFQAQMDKRFSAMQTEMDRRFDAFQAQMDKRFSAMQTEMDKRFDAVVAEFKLVRQEMKTMQKSIIITNGIVLVSILTLYKVAQQFLSG